MRSIHNASTGILVVRSRSSETAPALDPVRRASFGAIDVFRRIQGDTLALFGVAPKECAHQISASGPFWRLRDYGGRRGALRFLIVAAPIKRPYIWDLAPKVSAVRHCLENGLHVYLLEWLPASGTTGDNGIAEYANAIRDCAAKIAKDSDGVPPFAIGHSLGGTLAMIFAALEPKALQGLILLGAPLCFDPANHSFRNALLDLVPSKVDDTEPYPGSLLSYATAMACPEAFVWARLKDAAQSISDNFALEIHARVERWALDEVSLPGKLVHQIVEWLYRDNRFCRGELRIGNSLIGPDNFLVPTLAVVNTADDVASIHSIEPFIKAMATTDVRIIEYPGETGVCLQHLGFLIGRKAHAELWPEIMSWILCKRQLA